MVQVSSTTARFGFQKIKVLWQYILICNLNLDVRLLVTEYQISALRNGFFIY